MMIAAAVLMALVCACAAKEQLRIGVLFKPETGCDVKSKSGDKVNSRREPSSLPRALAPSLSQRRGRKSLRVRPSA